MPATTTILPATCIFSPVPAHTPSLYHSPAFLGEGFCLLHTTYFCTTCGWLVVLYAFFLSLFSSACLPTCLSQHTHHQPPAPSYLCILPADYTCRFRKVWLISTHTHLPPFYIRLYCEKFGFGCRSSTTTTFSFPILHHCFTCSFYLYHIYTVRFCAHTILLYTIPVPSCIKADIYTTTVSLCYHSFAVPGCVCLHTPTSRLIYMVRWDGSFVSTTTYLPALLSR